MFKVQPVEEQLDFEFDIEGTVYTVRRIKYLPVDLTLEIANDDSPFASLIAFGPEARAAIGKLTQDQAQALISAWFEDSGIDLGESVASESS